MSDIREAFEKWFSDNHVEAGETVNLQMKADMWAGFQAARAQGDAEPAGWVSERLLEDMLAGKLCGVSLNDEPCADDSLPLYTHPHPAQPEVDWIKCSERLPTEADADWDDDVIVFDSEGDMAVTHYGVAEKCGNPGGSITHWKPTGLTRPHPPKSKEGSDGH